MSDLRKAALAQPDQPTADGPMLPEPPAFYRYQFDSQYGQVWRSSAESWNGQLPTASEGLYTADQMLTFRAEGVKEERERCATLVETHDVGGSYRIRIALADAIRKG